MVKCLPLSALNGGRLEPALYVMLNLKNNAVGIAGSLEELSAMPTARTSAE